MRFEGVRGTKGSKVSLKREIIIEKERGRWRPRFE